jgi:serine/threonine-protein kinase
MPAALDRRELATAPVDHASASISLASRALHAAAMEEAVRRGPGLVVQALPRQPAGTKSRGAMRRPFRSANPALLSAAAMARKRSAPKRPPACPSCGRDADPSDGPLNFCPACGADLRVKRGEATAPGALLEKVIADRYRLLGILGEGGMGSVYKAEHIRMGKALALKVLRGDFAADPGRVERFRAEARIVSRLSHPHTIAVFDFGEIEGNAGFYLAMEYVPGRDLAAVLREAGRLPEKRVAEIGQQILGSLAEAHDAGVVHRDMKPGNVMLMQTRSGEDFVKVLDFGIAKLRDETSSTSTTGAEAIVGTPSYLAPEQARGGVVDARTDLYAVGCLLHELVTGRPPFVAPSPMAVVSAHLHQEPPSLAQTPGVSRGFAEVVRRVLRKRPEDRFASADDMRDALLALGEPTPAHQSRSPSSPEVTGALRIARREDFRDFDRELRSLRRSRIAAPVSALVLAVGAAALAWKWTEAYSLLATRVPRVARALPPALRPSGTHDGDEHEPNDVPARANVLPLPPGPDGRPGGGIAIVRGHVGARLSETTGDVDIYRIEVPATGTRKVLVAEWRGERAGEGIRGLDVSIALNRDRDGGDPRSPAPLVAAADRGTAGQPERLAAAVEPGVHYLAVRERHDDATGPVEKPTDLYALEVRLEDPRPGEEVEPDDAPDRSGSRGGRYAEWRAVAERNLLGEGTVVHGETSADDRDTYAVAPRAPGETPRLVVAVPDPELALVARRWVPDAEDLAHLAPPMADRVRFEPEIDGAPGQAIVMALEAAPRAGAPVLVQFRAAARQGRYDVLALGENAASGAAALALVHALAPGRPARALEVAAAFATHLPRAAARNDILLAAGRAAEAAASSLAPADVRAYDRASQLLGVAALEVVDGKVRYRGAFEALADGAAAGADEAALRVVVLASPCTPDDVAGRAAAFLERRPAPASELVREARLVRARALEEAFWSGGATNRSALAAALAAWKGLAAGPRPPPEAVERVAALAARQPSRTGARTVCP